MNNITQWEKLQLTFPTDEIKVTIHKRYGTNRVSCHIYIYIFDQIIHIKDILKGFIYHFTIFLYVILKYFSSLQLYPNILDVYAIKPHIHFTKFGLKMAIG